MVDWVGFNSMSTYSLRSTPISESPAEVLPAKQAGYATRMFPQDYTNQRMSESFSPTSQKKPIEATTVLNSTSTRRKSHPTIARMIDEAIFERSTRAKGLSLYGVKRFMRETYGINTSRSSKRICSYIRQSVESGRLLRRTGRGANGSFRLAPEVRLQLKKEKNTTTVRSRIARSSGFKIRTFVGNIRRRKTNQGDSLEKRKTLPARARKKV